MGFGKLSGYLDPEDNSLDVNKVGNSSIEALSTMYMEKNLKVHSLFITPAVLICVVFSVSRIMVKPLTVHITLSGALCYYHYYYYHTPVEIMHLLKTVPVNPKQINLS